MSYVAGEWAVAQRPDGGGWVILGAPRAADGQCYRVVWPVPADVQGLVTAYHNGVWSRPEFAGTVGAIGKIIDGIRDVGEYHPEPAFSLTDWVTAYEGAA